MIDQTAFHYVHPGAGGSSRQNASIADYCWRRDTVGQLATSNFSNAGATTFQP